MAPYSELTTNFWKFLSFLNEKNSVLFFVVFHVVFFGLGGIFQWAIAIVVAFVSSFVLHKFVLNRIQPVPAQAAVLITGCSSGMGLEATYLFAKQGFHVFPTVRKQEDATRLLAGAPESLRALISPVILDVTDEASLAAARDEITNRLAAQHLYLFSVINNAGFSQQGVLEAVSPEMIHSQFSTNVYGVIRVSHYFAPLLRQATNKIKQVGSRLKPSFLLVGSSIGEEGLPGAGLYGASKHALQGLAIAFRAELGPQGINVVLIQPGGVNTPFLGTMQQKTPQSVDIDPKDPAHAFYNQLLTNINENTQEVVSKTLRFFPTPDQAAEAFLEPVLTPNPYSKYAFGIDAQIFLTLARWLPIHAMCKIMSLKVTPTYNDKPNAAK